MAGPDRGEQGPGSGYAAPGPLLWLIAQRTRVAAAPATGVY